MAVTMKEIAQHCGLSGGAVSQVLRNPENPRFSPETRKRILEAAAKLEYRQNPLSRALRTSKTNLLGLMLPWNEPEVMDCIERVACENGYKLMIQFTAHPRGGAEREALKSFLDWNVDGILWEPSAANDDLRPLLDQIKRNGPPLVLLERGPQTRLFPLIRTDYGPAIRECAAHLREQRFRKVVFIAPLKDHHLMSEIAGHIEAGAAANGLEYEACLLRDTLPPTDEIREFLTAPRNTNTAFICRSWLIIDFIEAMESLNMQAPRDTGYIMLIDTLIGGRYRVSNLLRPTATSLLSDSGKLAEFAVNHLLAEIHGEKKAPQLYYDQAKFTIQQSTNRKTIQ